MTFFSVVLSVYNGDTFLDAAIKSVLGQSFDNFEFIIIDDGSADKSLNIIKYFASLDNRIRYFSNDHKGLVSSLNFGISKCKGKYIARIDSDDLWHKKKLELQYQYLILHPDVALLGSSVIYINSNGNIIRHNGFNRGVFLTNRQIKKKLIRENIFCHSSVVFSKEAFYSVGGYEPSFKYSEDYQLWFKLLNKYVSVILSRKLTCYRIHNKMLSHIQKRKQLIQSFRVKRWAINNNYYKKYYSIINFYDLIRLYIKYFLFNYKSDVEIL